MLLTSTETWLKARSMSIVYFVLLITAALLSFVSSVTAAGLIYYALEDGQVRGMMMYGCGDADISIPPGAFFGTPPDPATGRNIAYDPHTDLLWYSASDNHVHSLVVDTLAPGPIISDIGDAIYGAIRTIAIDRNTRRLYISNSNGNVEVYSLITNSKMYTIPVSAFGASEPNPGNRRHLAADDAYGFLWYAAADGTFKEFDPFEFNPHYTDREIPVSEQVEPGSPGQERCFVIRHSLGWNYLYYASSDGTVQTANLDYLANEGSSYSDICFLTTTNPGALRSLAIDPSWTPPDEAPAEPTGVSASDGNCNFPGYVCVTWNPVTDADYYILLRRDLGGSTWLIVNLGIYDGTVAYDDYNIVPGDIYEYTVQACRTCTGCMYPCSNYGTEIDSGYMSMISTPIGLSASQGTLNDRVRLTWASVSGATGYMLGIQSYDGGPPISIWVDGITYDDMDALPAGTLWEYWVSACTSAPACSGNSDSAWGWIFLDLLAPVVPEWREGELCGTIDPNILTFIAYINNGYACVK